MRRPITLALLVASACASAQVCFDPAGLHHIAANESFAADALLRRTRSSPSRGYDLKYHRLELVTNPALRYITGAVTHYYTAITDLDDVVLDLDPALTVSAVTDGTGPLAFTRTDDKLIIQRNATLPAGMLDSLRVTYSGTPPETGFGSFIQAEHSGVPVLWTLSEPYGAKDWWPCKQDLNDKADSLDLLVRTPIGQRVAGNGVLVSVTDQGNGTAIHHWRHRHPINFYLVAFAVTNYAAYSNTVPLPSGPVEVLNYVFPEHLGLAQGVTPDIIGQMQLYSQLFGEYPFADEKYGHAEFGWGGGMEHQTMTFLGGFNYELLAHELAHQWFGDLVTCGSWQDLWLNEGFATYLSALCYENLAPQYWKPWLQARRDNITSQPGGSVFVTDTTSIGRLFDGRLTYAKGAYLLHMLRWVCGDQAFYAGINDYLNDPAIRNRSALTSQLVAHLEAASGQALTEFMADWYTGQGYPSYLLTWTQTADGHVSARLEQSTSHPSVSFFEMPVPVRFKQGTQSETVVLDHGFSGQVFEFDLAFQADSALVDPDLWILSQNAVVLHVPVAAFEGAAAVIYPNPATDAAWLHAPGLLGPVELSIHDAVGRLAVRQRLGADGRRIPVPVANLAPGSYTVRVDSENGDHLELRFAKP